MDYHLQGFEASARDARASRTKVTLRTARFATLGFTNLALTAAQGVACEMEI